VRGGAVGAVTTTAGHVRGQRGGGCHGEDITGVVWAVENITAPRCGSMATRRPSELDS